ncbi:MAG TPA: sulfate adenylyltransferase small subunit, partial [Saprospirales bacterium]|nr:sulfate adenylyltransferase small subunit [Saprospirales bacterium]
MRIVNHLSELESESIYIMREVAAQFDNSVLMFSGGKDSILMVYLAYKAFFPAKIPFPLLHIDTGHNFPETLQYRDKLVKQFGAKLVIGSVQDTIDQGLVAEEKGFNASRNGLQTTALLEAIENGNYD